MNSNDNGRAEARSLANRRLRRLTIGTAMLGVAATGTIGLLAAVTYDGATAVGAETAIVSNSTSASTDTATSTTAPSTRRPRRPPRP